MGKYVSAMVAAGARLTYAQQHAAGARLTYAQQHESKLWMAIVLVTSLVATTYQLYWDFVKDWGLLNPKSKNPWLRDDLIVKNKSIYYVSIVSFPRLSLALARLPPFSKSKTNRDTDGSRIFFSG